MSEIEQIKAIVKNAIFNDSLVCVDPEEIQKLISTIESSQARIKELEAEVLEVTQTYNAFILELNNVRGLIVPTLEARIEKLEQANKIMREALEMTQASNQLSGIALATVELSLNQVKEILGE